MTDRDTGGAHDGGHPVLDVPLNLREAPSRQVREELEDLVRRDLLGPWGGETEEFAPKAKGPLERYLVGRLGPKQEPTSSLDPPEEGLDAEISAGGDGEESELTDVLTPQNAGRLWASSMGLSFAVAAGTDAVHVTATWGRYDKTTTLDEDGTPRSVWSREPLHHTRELRLDGPATQRLPLTVDTPDQPGVHLRAEVRPGGRGTEDGARVVELTLVNTQHEPSTNRDVAWLFQPRLTVTALDGADAVFVPIDDPLRESADPHLDTEERHLRLLYQDELRYAAGRNVAVHADVAADRRRAHRLHTTWVPTYEVPATIAPTVDDSPYLAGLELSMDTLAEAAPADLATGLAPLADGYAAWLDDRDADLADLPDHLRPTGEAAVFTARQAAERIRAGVALLADPAAAHHEEALAAFRFANRAMALQRRHTQLAQLRETEGIDYAEAQRRVLARGAAAASWRPFQLAFVLLNLPSLTDPAHPDRATTVDLLFFPTGGGKTEAYLGLAAYTFAIRRLQGVVGTGEDARSGEAGVAVLMRYTLRLLTAQQFQRAAALVCAAEVLRRDAVAAGDHRWGDTPFRIGLWVGGKVSPNRYDDAAQQVSDARDSGSGSHDTVLQTLACPWCGTALAAWRDLRTDDDLRRVLLYCPNAEGQHACPFSELRSPREGLPILTVDEEIYRLAPSLLVATVDKLAQLPWRGYAGILFGRVSRRCPRHGYRHDDLDTNCGSRHNAKGTLPAATSEPVTRLRPPDLIIQDELHLISGALGTVVGQFEAAVAELCRWHAGGVETGPKIVASTATTKRAREQVAGIFAHDLAVFPPPVLNVRDTFFSRQVPVSEHTPGRRYLGLCAHGVRLKQAEIRLAESLLLAAQTLFDTYGAAADPYMTLVGYFNSTRELAGMRRYLDDDVTIRVRRHGTPKGLSNRLVSSAHMLSIQELTSRVSSGEISSVLNHLETGFDPRFDTSVRRKAVNDEIRAASAEKRTPRLPDRPGGRPPVDVLLATSMLQVGVDVSRFGLMTVTGQPKNTAEYIQASSRVGRDPARPGLVVTLYNWSRPRDLAHFEDFEHYHATFYRQVEALSVTPYTRRSLDRGAAATFVAAVRNAEERFSRNTDAHDVPLDSAEVEEVTRRLLERAEAVAGPRGREYLAERIEAVKDTWDKARQGSSRLGYRRGSFRKQRLRGLLTSAGGADWSELTVPQSMRETENEINLLVPGTGLFTPVRGAPEWSFAPPSQDGADSDAAADDDSALTDEMGDSILEAAKNTKKRKR
ncbi:DISARM system helicase DrmA [Salinactinospora qingdaonensis]|uniref:DISARM system helicase DrmA n=1 Tax=Salinactinospora qingdaonensis TaxID=702744 RepID=A0ABP7G3X3_9ACTN